MSVNILFLSLLFLLHFNVVKRLLGLSYLWTGSLNGIKLQIWSTCGATRRYPKGYAERYALELPSGRVERYPYPKVYRLGLGRRKTLAQLRVLGFVRGRTLVRFPHLKHADLKLRNAHRWLFYSVLVDLGDGVADDLSLPFDLISLEMIYRCLY